VEHINAQLLTRSLIAVRTVGHMIAVLSDVPIPEVAATMHDYHVHQVFSGIFSMILA